MSETPSAAPSEAPNGMRQTSPNHPRKWRLPVWPLIALGIGTLLMQMWLERYPLGPRLWHLPLVAASWILVLAGWLFLWTGRRPRWFWLPPLIFLLAQVASLQSWSFHMAFGLSRPAFDSLAIEAAAAFPTLQWQPHPIGFYTPLQISATRRLIVVDFPDNNTFLYAPDGLPADWHIQTMPLPAAGWFATKGRVPATTADLVAQELFRTGDSRPQSSDFLFRSLAVLPQESFGYHAAQDSNYRAESFAPSGQIPWGVRAMARMGAPVVNDLATALRANTAQPICYLAALGLMDGGAAPAALDIASFLKDSRPDVRQTAAWALGRIGSSAKAQLPALWSAFADADPAVRENARIAIESIGPDRSSSPGIILRWKKMVMDADRMAADAAGIDQSAARSALVDMIAAAGPDASPIAEDIVSVMVDSIAVLRSQGSAPSTAPGKAAADADRQAIKENRILAVREGVRMLTAIGPRAGDEAAPLVRVFNTMLREHIGMERAGDHGGLALELIQWLAKVDPRDPAIISALEPMLAQSRNGSLLDPDDTSRDQTDRPAYFYRRELAAMFLAYDPQNIVLLTAIRNGLRAAVNSPERRWALDLAAVIKMPNAELTPVLRPMIVDGKESVCAAAAHLAASLVPLPVTLADPLVMRIDANLKAPAAATQPKNFDAMIEALPGIDPNSPKVAECLLRALPVRRDAAVAGLSLLQGAAEDALTAILKEGDPQSAHLIRLLAISMGPRAKAAVPILVRWLSAAQGEDERHETLEALSRIGPDAGAAIPTLVARSAQDDAFRQDAKEALTQIGVTRLSAKELTELLKSPASRDIILTFAGGSDVRLLPALLSSTSGNPEMRQAVALHVCTLAGEKAVPLNQLAPFVDEAMTAHTTVSPVPAILKAQGSVALKADQLLRVLDARVPAEVKLSAIPALVALHPVDEVTHEALVEAAYGADIQDVRSALFTAIHELYAGTR